MMPSNQAVVSSASNGREESGVTRSNNDRGNTTHKRTDWHMPSMSPTPPVNVEVNRKDSETIASQYGLNGILNTVRMSYAPLSLLSLGTDLTMLGLNLDTPDTLYTSFYSPNMDQQPSKEEIEFYLPPCCYINPPSWKMAHLQKFTAETLFYMFYTIVGDVLQGYAAAELLNRGWFYHTEYEKWFSTIAAQRAIGASELREQQEQLSENAWIYFEPSLWAKRLYTGDLDIGKFLKSDSLRERLEEPPQAAAAAEAAQDQQAALLQLRQQQQAVQQAQQALQQVQQAAQQAPNSLPQQLPGLLSQPPQQFGSSQGLGPGIGFHSGMGMLGGTSSSGRNSLGGTFGHPFLGQHQHLQGNGISSNTEFGGLLASNSQAVSSSSGGLSGNTNQSSSGNSTRPSNHGMDGSPISVASLQTAIEALLARGLPPQ